VYIIQITQAVAVHQYCSAMNTVLHVVSSVTFPPKSIPNKKRLPHHFHFISWKRLFYFDCGPMRPFFFIRWCTGIFLENLISEGGKKINKKRLLFIFLRNIPQCLCRMRNKKNNHHFKVLKILLIYVFQTYETY
jgi:hypothetical protein